MQGALKFYDLNEVADLLKVSTMTVRRWIKTGKLKAVRIGRKYLITEDTILQFVNQDKEV
jgi:excisionase family DNA binding protein